MRQSTFLWILPAALFLASCAENREDTGGEVPPAVEKSTPKDESPVKDETPPPAPGDEDFIGLSIDEAKALAEKRGQPHRVTSIDGNPRMATADFVPDRLNFEIENGRVVAVKRG